MAYTPTLRAPSGIPAAPLVIVSGVPKSGKSLSSYRLSMSPRIDTCFVIDLGEGSADEYAEAGPYQVVEWGSSFSDLAATIKWCVAQQPADGKLNAVILDSGTELWDGIKNRATQRARGTKKARSLLEQDPDAEVDVSMNLWNDAATTWTGIINPLRISPHVVGVVIVRADEVAEVVNGAPNGRRSISLAAHKSLPSVATAHVRITPDHVARLIEVRSLKVQVPTKGLELAEDNPLGHLLDLVAPSGAFAAPVVQVPEDVERDDPERDAWWAEIKERFATLDEAGKELARLELVMAQLLDAETRKPLTPFTRPQLLLFESIVAAHVRSEVES